MCGNIKPCRETAYHFYSYRGPLPEPNATHPNYKNFDSKALEKENIKREEKEMEKAKPLLRSPQNLNLIGPQRVDPHPPFTDAELAVAEQLIHLSESTGPDASANSMASASSSTRSVNAPAPATQAPLDDVVGDDDGLWRRNKRYRPIADVYASTVPIDVEGGGKKETRKKKGSNGVKAGVRV